MEPGRFDNHIDEEELERYSMERLAGARLEEVEEHLLICPECQDRLEAIDGYIRAIRSAAVRERKPEIPMRRPGWRAAWAVAAASAVLVMGVVVMRSARDVQAPAAVRLEAVRGPLAAHAVAPARHSLAFSLDVTELPAHPVYRVEVVDERGRRLWSGEAEMAEGRLAVTVSRGFSPGRYYVRLYSPAAELLREYGVEMTPR